MASSVKQKHPTEEDKDSIINVNQQHETGDSFITLKQPHQQTGNSSTITVKQENQTGDSIITLKHQHQTGGDSIITVKHEHQTGDSFITVKKKQQHPTGEEEDSIINVEVVNPLNRSIVFRVKRNKPLQVILTKWKEMEGITDYQKVYFIYNEHRISDDDIYKKNKTVKDIGLKDGDCITAQLSFIGD
ncbi:hypothetical protein OSB04_017327 [Centaurea solstitialis]|uniref:Rad60/SUMO-like domain-containing protein n=1 Tax=Centaurea solstitialis TaxID=347529 RepID=A0AA38W9D3_9ASTR|nr:hypothetical protein OSB04_017327 [Centaurea solstitialis]